MKAQLLENNYVVIDNFVNPEHLAYLSDELERVRTMYPESFETHESCPNSISIGDMWIFLELLVEKIPFISEIIKEPVFPTYSQARIYKNGGSLVKHTDRGSCEISVTLHLGSDGVEWPIYFETPDKQTVAVNLKPGQAAVYLGCAAVHWRDVYEGTDYRQVFLHYVRARGENRKYYFDSAK